MMSNEWFFLVISLLPTFLAETKNTAVLRNARAHKFLGSSYRTKLGSHPALCGSPPGPFFTRQCERCAALCQYGGAAW